MLSGLHVYQGWLINIQTVKKKYNENMTPVWRL